MNDVNDECSKGMVPGRKARIRGNTEQKEDEMKETKKQKEIENDVVSHSVGRGKNSKMWVSSANTNVCIFSISDILESIK